MFDDYDHELAIIGVQGGGRTDYRVESTGEMSGEQVNSSDDIGEKYVQGHVNGGEDIVAYNGHLKGIGFGDEVGEFRLERDGQVKWPFHLNMRTLRLEAHHTPTPYRVTVSSDGRLIKSGSISAEDELLNDGRTAEGAMSDGGVDVWYFSGGLESVDSNQSPTVLVDGEEKPIEGNPPQGIVEYDG